MADKKKFATVNFSNMNVDAFNMLSTFQASVTALALAEKALKDKNDTLKDKDKDTKKKLNEKERLAKKNAIDRADTLATMFMTRYIGIDSVLKGDIYHFDVVDFLRNIEVLSDGEIDKKSLDKIKAICALTVDRKKQGIAERKKYSDKLSLPVPKDINNSPTELVLSIVMVCVESGAIEYSQGGLAFVDFSKK